MGRPRLSTDLKKPSDYHYDYPETREISKYLKVDDKKFIIEKTNYTYTYITQVCKGERKNSIIEEWIYKIAQLNIEKQQKLNNQDKEIPCIGQLNQ